METKRYVIIFILILLTISLFLYIQCSLAYYILPMYNVVTDRDGISETLVEDEFDLTTINYQKVYKFKPKFRGPHVIEFMIPIDNPKMRDIRSIYYNGLLIIEYVSNNEIVERKEISSIDSYVFKWKDGIPEYMYAKVDVFIFYRDICHKSIDTIKITVGKPFGLTDAVQKIEHKVRLQINYYTIL